MRNRRPIRYAPQPAPEDRAEDYVDPDEAVETTKYAYRNRGLYDRDMVHSRQNETRDRRGRY